MGIERQRTVRKSESASDLWRRIEQTGLDNALKQLLTYKSRLSTIASLSSENVATINNVMQELCDTLNGIRAAFVENEQEIFDNDERKNRYLTTTCPLILQIWSRYSAFVMEFAVSFDTRGWIDSEECKDVLPSVLEATASVIKLLGLTVNVEDFQNLNNADTLKEESLQETVQSIGGTKDLLTKILAFGENHSAINVYTELLGWMLYGVQHMTNHVIKADIEARSSDSNFTDCDNFYDSLNLLLAKMRDKLGDNKEQEESIPAPLPVPPLPVPILEHKITKQSQVNGAADKKKWKKMVSTLCISLDAGGRKKQTKPSTHSKNEDSNETHSQPEQPVVKDNKKTKNSYLELIQKFSITYKKFSDDAWLEKRLPEERGAAGALLKYRMECYDQIGKLELDVCAMDRRLELLDTLKLTNDHLLHSDLFVIVPTPLKCSNEVIIQFPLKTIHTQTERDIYVNVRVNGEWNKIENPSIVKNEDQTCIEFNTTSCDAFTAVSFSPADILVVGQSGANYVNKENGQVEVTVPRDCFHSDVTMRIKTLSFDERSYNDLFDGIVNASVAVEITSDTNGVQMDRNITVLLPMTDDKEDKDTELVVVRSNETIVQVLDKKQIAIKCTNHDGVYSVDSKGFWCVAVMRIRRIFLNMRETIKKEFLVGYGKKLPCTILTFIDDTTRRDERQVFIMELAERCDVEDVVQRNLQFGLYEIKKGRSKDILVSRGDQILMQIDGQMRATEAVTEKQLTICYIKGGSNIVSISTEIKREPEKLPDAMIFYKQIPNGTSLHSIAITTRDLSELPTEEITARSGMHVSNNPTKQKEKEEAAVQLLKMESLMTLARELTFEEGSLLGRQLGVKPEKIKQIKESEENDPVVANFQILCNWRGRSARATMADFLVSSLKAVGKMNYADLVIEVRKRNRGLQKEDFEKDRRRKKTVF